MSKVVTSASNGKQVYVEPKNIPSLSKLTAQVHDIELKSSWYERYGVDAVQFIAAACALPLGLLVLCSNTIWRQALGIFLLCCYHTSLTSRAGHLASHGALADSTRLNYFLHVLLGEFIGSFSTKCGHDIHIKFHHPFTNIVGLGDSSTWKAPFLPCYVYMFLMPLGLPLFIPFLALQQLISERNWKYLVMFLIICPAGILFHFTLLVYISGYTASSAVAVMWAYRCGLAIPYIHINIFQHIGLPMYSPDNRPVRIYQMSTGCLNLSPNPIFNFVFGHSLVSCHVEHHLFPRLSDNMCRKVKPIVSRYLMEGGLPYHEDSYIGRLRVFLDNFDSLMIDAPPVFHFITGLS